MERTPAPDPSTEHAEHRAHRTARRAIQGFVAAGVFAGTVWASSYLLHSSQTNIATSVSTIVLLMAVGTLLLSGMLAFEVIYWRLPTMRLKRLIDEIHHGEAPIDDLNKLSRGVRPLAESLTQILQESKSWRAKVNELNQEMQQRIVNRTDALERKLGAMKTKAARDGLTGLSNRRSFDEELPRIIEACRAERRDLVLMMIDVDYFKILNDTLGHQAGDDLLRSIGQIIRSTLRETDSAYRYGGDEFVLLMPGADPTSAHALMNRLKHLVEGLTRPMRNVNPRPGLTIGFAALSELPPTLGDDALLLLADQRLYAIKHARAIPSRRSA